MAFADDVKTFCNTDDDLTAYIASAEKLLDGKGVPVDEDNPLYQIAVKQIVSTWYDQRDASADLSGLNGIILDLQIQQEADDGAN
ncbi:MAG: head-tail connector protein [Ethanoligenens sp.]